MVIDTGNRSLSNQHLCPINRIVSAQLKVGCTEYNTSAARVNLIPSPFDHYTPLKRYVTTRRAVFIVSQALNVKSHLSVETSAKLFRSKTTLLSPPPPVKLAVNQNSDSNCIEHDCRTVAFATVFEFEKKKKRNETQGSSLLRG